MTEQEKRDKVIKALECCTKKVCCYNDIEKECPYWELCGEYEEAFEDCTTALAKDALVLLKAQEPMVMVGAELTDEELIEKIRKAPIVMKPNVDVVPVVHARWIEEETSENTIDEWQSAKCTNCGKYHTVPYLYYFSEYNYCPNCGAKMDGERRDSE